MYNARERCLPLCLPREQEKAREDQENISYNALSLRVISTALNVCIKIGVNNK
jgi:hypothetical protein